MNYQQQIQQQQQQQAVAQAQAAARYQQQRYYYQQQQAQAQGQVQQYHPSSLPQPQINEFIDQRLSNNNTTTSTSQPITTESNHSTPPTTTNTKSNSYVGGILMNNGILNETDPKLASHMDLNELVTSERTSVTSSTTNKVGTPTNNNTTTTSNNNTPSSGENNIITTSHDVINSNSDNTSPPSHSQSLITNSNSQNNNNINNNINNTTTTNTTSTSTTTNPSSHSSNNPLSSQKQDFKTDFSFREVSQQNKNIYNYAMNNNPHAINDPSIQESLSPYFQPFGVDVSHLPMTNPPIFQNSVPLFDEPVRRRRISISNGQISQLGEDIETVENLYNTQPPPMPRFNNNNNHNNNNTTTTTEHKPQGNLLQPLPIVTGNENDPSWTAPVLHPSTLQQRYGIPTTAATTGAAVPPIPPTSDEIGGVMGDNGIMMQSQLPISINQSIPQQQQSLQQQQQNTSNGGINMVRSNPYIKKESISSVSSGHSRQSMEDKEENTPGTPAWKRARLLERNRVAASKCRQRKKIAQLQLQKDFDNLSRENMIIKKKLNYYEKLISKFKKFTESHFQKCHASDDFKDLKMIEEMLMIDQDVFEVNENGTVLKMAENSYM